MNIRKDRRTKQSANVASRLKANVANLSQVKHVRNATKFIETCVSDPIYFDTDPDPRVNNIFKNIFFMVLVTF